MAFPLLGGPPSLRRCEMDLFSVLCFSLVITSALVPRVPLRAYAPLQYTHPVYHPTVCIFDTHGLLRCSEGDVLCTILGRKRDCCAGGLAGAESEPYFNRVSLRVGMFRAPSAGGQMACMGSPRPGVRVRSHRQTRHNPHNLHTTTC